VLIYRKTYRNSLQKNVAQNSKKCTHPYSLTFVLNSKSLGDQMDEIKKIERFKLLTPKKGGSFIADMLESRSKNGDSGETHLLHERLVFSYLAYKARNQLAVSARQISDKTRLHHQSVNRSLQSLAGCVVKVGNKWQAMEPPEGWFALRKCENEPDCWADRFAYTTLLIPRLGAKIIYQKTTRRFGINHAAIYSFLVNRGQVVGGVINNFTVSGQAKMLGISRPTVRSVIDDLLYLGFIGVADLGYALDITLKPLNENLLSFFEPKPVAKEVPPIERQPRESERYELLGDGFDDWRKSCKFLMPQSSCEEGIVIAKKLGDCLLGFRDQIRMSKEQHDTNMLKGKIGRGNFGKYFVTRMRTRLEEKQRQEREFEAQANLQEYYRSEKYKAEANKRELEAAADPLHELHIMRIESILDRVLLADSPLANVQEAEKIRDSVYNRIHEHLTRNGGRVETSHVIGQRNKVLAHALADLNCYYRAEKLATANQLKEQIDTILVRASIAPVFAKFSEKESSI
jgi:hypothetical protein